MTTIPTPAEFLASSEPDEEYDDLDPMTSFEHRLRMLESWVYDLSRGSKPVEAALESTACTECTELRTELYPALDKAEGRAAGAEALIEQIEGIVKKSTSQVSLAVKAAIEAWRNPVSDAQQPGPETPSPAQDAPAVDEAAAGPLVQAPEQDVPQASAGEGLPPGHGQVVLPQPAVDAPVEEWRAYARAMHAVPDGTVLDQMNRSQIRTLLGIEQPVTPAGA